MMNQWDICLYPFVKQGPHYVVVISSTERAAGQAEFVNGLFAQSVRPGGHQLDSRCEVALDRADGMDWATAVRCDFFHQLERKLLKPAVGAVSYQRQILICRMIRAHLRLDMG